MHSGFGKGANKQRGAYAIAIVHQLTLHFQYTVGGMPRPVAELGATEPMLRMGQVQFDRIRQHGEEAYPHECCGVLLGHIEEGVNTVIDAVPAENTRSDSAHNRYHIAPQELICIQQQARRQGLDIVGFYHSHPDHPAEWSKTDLEEAHWLECSYVITSVVGNAADGGAGTGRCRATETNSFLLAGTGEEDKRLERQPIEVAAGVGVG